MCSELTQRKFKSALQASALFVISIGMLGVGGCGVTSKSASNAANASSTTNATNTPSTPSSPSTAPSSQAAALISASATNVSFGEVVVGSATAQLVTLTNGGGANLNIGTVSATGNGFTTSGGSNVTLVPNQSVTVSVNFDPATAGQASGSLSVSSNASNSVVQIALSGTGVAASQHSVELTWSPSPSQVIGYFIYRSASASGPYSKLNASVNPSSTFTDSEVANSMTYYYAVTSVDSSNVESAFSNEVVITIP